MVYYVIEVVEDDLRSDITAKVVAKADTRNDGYRAFEKCCLERKDSINEYALRYFDYDDHKAIVMDLYTTYYYLLIASNRRGYAYVDLNMEDRDYWDLTVSSTKYQTVKNAFNGLLALYDERIIFFDKNGVPEYYSFLGSKPINRLSVNMNNSAMVILGSGQKNPGFVRKGTVIKLG